MVPTRTLSVHDPAHDGRRRRAESQRTHTLGSGIRVPKNKEYKTMRVLSVLVVLVTTSAAATATQTSDLRRTWTLYHSTDPSKGEQGFAKRGIVTLQPADNEIKLSVENDPDCLSQKDLEEMMMSGWYQVKLVENGPDAKSVVPVMTTVPACTVRRANFRDELTLIFGQKGHIMSIAYSPLVSPLAPKTCDELSVPADIQFNSRVEYEAGVPGMALKTVLSNYQPPPGLKFLPGKNKATAGGATGSSSDAKPEGFETKKEEEAPTGIMGFLTKYWYIVLPLMIMNLISAEPPQDQQGQSAGGGGNAAAQAAPPAAGSGGANKRRGKRE